MCDVRVSQGFIHNHFQIFTLMVPWQFNITDVIRKKQIINFFRVI